MTPSWRVSPAHPLFVPAPLSMPLPKLARPIAQEPEHEDLVRSSSSPALPTDARWKLLAEIGLVLAIVGAVDLALTWYPLSFGNAEWEFGTITATFDGLPLLTLGLGLALAGARQGGSPLARRALRMVFAVLGIALIGAGVLYATVVPLAMRSLSDPAVEIGLFRAMLKTVVQAILYPALFLWLAFRRSS